MADTYRLRSLEVSGSPCEISGGTLTDRVETWTVVVHATTWDPSWVQGPGDLGIELEITTDAGVFTGTAHLRHIADRVPALLQFEGTGELVKT